MNFGQRALLWLLFFLISLGLGYSTLNRYDPRKSGGTFDVGVYYDIVTGRAPLQTSEDPRGRVLSWDPALFGLLMANGIFTATTACLLVSVGYRLLADYATALLGATLYLLNFVVANLNMAGMIDSGEGCLLMAMVWSLLADRWSLLPLWGILGSLAKETFAPLSVVFAFGWWLAEARWSRPQVSRLIWICALGVTGLITVTIVMSSASAGLIWPWQFALHMHSGGTSGVGFLAGLLRSILDRTFWYVFIWLLPLGVMQLHQLPRSWVLASALAFSAALAMGAYNDALGNTARALFNVAGPILSLSSAVLLTKPRGLSTCAAK